MVGMGTMVGSATGAALTAVAMVFEMTRDYDIVLPMILAVAVGLGVRRVISRENIYTMKLVRRGHPIPRALHANMFLVRSARDLMDRDYLLIDEATTFEEFLRLAAGSSGMCHVVVTRGKLIVGVLRVNTNLRQTVSAAASDVKMGALAQRNFTIVRPGEVVFDVIARLRRRGAVMGIVADGPGRPRAGNVVGVITKEHIADEVANSVRMYPR
jgi:CIC family chloride channel protein